jgi:hypothetical protein
MPTSRNLHEWVRGSRFSPVSIIIHTDLRTNSLITYNSESAFCCTPLRSVHIRSIGILEWVFNICVDLMYLGKGAAARAWPRAYKILIPDPLEEIIHRNDHLDLDGYPYIEMVVWDSASTSPTLHHSCRQALSNFFHAFQKDDPWWFSLLHPVGSDKDTCLSYLLGLDHSVAVDFFCCTGLMKVGHSRNARATVVMKAEWEMESLKKTAT